MASWCLVLCEADGFEAHLGEVPRELCGAPGVEDRHVAGPGEGREELPDREEAEAPAAPRRVDRDVPEVDEP